MAEGARLEGEDSAAQWAALADAWADLGRPFRSALARWRGAEAAEAAGDRDAAVVALREAHGIGAGLRRRIIERFPQCDVIIHKDVARD